MQALSSHSSSHYLLRDEYADLRNTQDKHLNVELNAIRNSVSSVKDGLNRLEHKVEVLNDDVSAFKEDVRAQFDRLGVEALRFTALLRNSLLKNPTHRIHPIVIYQPGKGLVEPDRSRFPRHAKEFYSLRNPTTDRHRTMLAYLAIFYDIPLNTTSSSSEDESDDDEVILDSPDLAVEHLEGILGLNEDNFIRFRERAEEVANAPRQPIKRSQILSPDEALEARRRKLAIRQATTHSEAKDAGNTEGPGIGHRWVSAESLDKAHVGWGNRSTPSSKRPTIARLHRQQEEQQRQQQEQERQQDQQQDHQDRPEPEDSGSPTNAFTSPREP